MGNKFGIPKKELLRIRTRDKLCVYCQKAMIYPCIGKKRRDWATVEHLNFDGPFYWNDGLKISDIAICCGSCNSSRGIKKLEDWFLTRYCLENGINIETVAEPIKKYLKINEGT